MYLTPLNDIPNEEGLFIAKNEDEDEVLVEVVKGVGSLAFIFALRGGIKICLREDEYLKKYTWYGPIVLIDKE